MSSVEQSKHWFSGEFRHTLDGKHRITIPFRWRRDDSDEFFLMAHQEYACIVALTPSECARVEENMAAKIPLERQASFRRMFAHQMHQNTADKQGRLLLPEELCTRANLASEVVLVGGMGRFEIWNPGAWKTYVENHQTEFQRDAAALGL